MENICKKENLCTGCTACASVCPKKCITMKPNKEGFKYPEINQDECIDCGLCAKTCPVNNMPEKEGVKAAYVGRYKDLDIVDNSTSGGTCEAFANYTFSQDGLLCGARYDDKFVLRHFIIDKEQKEDLKYIRGSKYLQSDLGDTISRIKEHLDNGKFVCFIGTPCQVGGLKAGLRKNYDNLMTVDLICRGVSAPYIFKEYLKYQSKRYKSLPKVVRFRNKTYGYHNGSMMIEFENGKKYYGGAKADYMLKAYFKGACSRKSCFECPYKGIERCSDITVFDSWHASELMGGKKDDDRGYTNIIVHTEKGMKIIKEMDSYFMCEKVDVKAMHDYDGSMIDGYPGMAACRDNLMDDINEYGFADGMQKNLPIKFKNHVAEKSKGALYKLGILRAVKSVHKKINRGK